MTQEHSYWLDVSQPSAFPRCEGALSVDAVIVGGGIAGVSAAYALQEAGLTVALVEKHTIASGTTAGTTGKVTSQHGLIYSELISRFGKQQARHYADGYSEAIADMRGLINQHGIDCGWTEQDNYVYTADRKKIDMFRREAVAAAALGLPAHFEPSTPLPFPTVAAVRFRSQAFFNAAEYTRELARIVQKRGGLIFEHSQAEQIKEGTPCTVKTKQGSIAAKHIVIATKIPPAPLVARASYAALVYPHTSYIVAGKTANQLTGMYISPDNGHYSILLLQDGPVQRILIGGEHHIPKPGGEEHHYKKLATYAHQWFGVTDITYRWKAMDYIAYDSVPVVGPLYPWSKHIFAVTGFKKWGLSTSMLAAKIIRGYITSQPLPQTALFYPHRTSAPLAIPHQILQEAKHFLKLS